MAALARGLKEAVRDIPESVTDIHVLADNQAALKSILAAGRGPSQLTSVAACQSVRPWLAASTEHRIHIRRCPGHEGVWWNEKVDKAAGLATSDPSNQTSFAYVRQQITASVYRSWQDDMARLAYCGHNSLIVPTMFGKCKHTSANWFLKKAGHSNTYFARMVRFISGHYPHGAFRERFHFEGNQACWCRKLGVETREHAWFDCELWIRKHKPPDKVADEDIPGGRDGPLDFRDLAPPGEDQDEYRSREWQKKPPKLEDIAEFLTLNPVLATFPWLELVDNAFHDLEQGDAESIAVPKAHLHTHVRKVAYERWVEEHEEEKPLTEFNAMYAVKAVEVIASRFMISADDHKVLEREFGLPPPPATDGNVSDKS